MELKKFLNDNADSVYAEFNRKLIPTKRQIIGVRLPTLKKFAKQLKAQDIQLSDNISHEEVLLFGFNASCQRTESEQLESLEKVLPFIDNWCTCDCIVAALKRLTGQNAFEFFKALLKDEREFYVRVGILGMMRYFLKTEKLSETLELLRAVKNEAYYVKMALAWFYAELCVTNYSLGAEEIEKICDKFTRNKAISKARESYRLTSEEKSKLNALKMK